MVGHTDDGKVNISAINAEDANVGVSAGGVALDINLDWAVPDDRVVPSNVELFL